MKYFLFIVLLVVVIISVGCVSNNKNTVITPTQTTIATMQNTVQTTALPTSIPAPTTTKVTARVTTAITTSKPENQAGDPILHRWVRQYPNTNTSINEWQGYEFIFYPEGSVIYNYGVPKMISSNLLIDPTLQMSGTWTNVGNEKYIVKLNPATVGGSSIIREYTRIPTYEDKRYPGKIIKEHIESSYEKNAIEKAQIPKTDEMFYPERAKID
jgi:hypothetical protein